MKRERQALILQLIAEYEVGTQEELQALLEAHDMHVTQATLSRDLHALKLTKQHRDGKLRYVRSDTPTSATGIFREAVLRTDSAGHMAVIHCRPGMAQAVCAALDRAKQNGIVGTIAGDDTIFVLMRTEQQAAAFSAQFETESICETEKD
jgi:transcriptional regulator of arginine metabolism